MMVSEPAERWALIIVFRLGSFRNTALVYYSKRGEMRVKRDLVSTTGGFFTSSDRTWEELRPPLFLILILWAKRRGGLGWSKSSSLYNFLRVLMMAIKNGAETDLFT